MAGRVDDVHTIHHCLLSLKLFASSRFLSLNWPAGCHVCGCLMSHQLNWLAGSCWEAEQDSTGHPCRAVNGLSEWRSLLYWRKSACRRTHTHTDWLTDWLFSEWLIHWLNLNTDWLAASNRRCFVWEWKHSNIVVFCVHHQVLVQCEKITLVLFLSSILLECLSTFGLGGVWK